MKNKIFFMRIVLLQSFFLLCNGLGKLSVSAQTLLDINNLIQSEHYLAAKEALTKVQNTELNYICDYYLGSDALAYAEDCTLSNRTLALKSNTLVRMGEYEKAYNLQKKIKPSMLSKKEKNEYENYKILNEGYLKYKKQDYKSALTDFQKLEKNQHYCSGLPVFIADCQMKQSQFDEATKTLDGFQSSSDELMNEAMRVRGETLYGLKKYSESIPYLEQSKSENPDVQYKLGLAYMQIQQYDKAILPLSNSIKESNDVMRQSALLNLGIAYMQIGNKTQSRMAFQQASEMSCSSDIKEEALYNYALCLHEGNTMGFGEAVTVFETFLNTFPQSSYANAIGQHLAEVYLTTKNYKKALQSISNIKQPNKEVLQAKQNIYYNLGTQSFNLGKYDEAEQYMQQAINVGNYDKQVKADALYWKGESEYRQKKYAAAIKSIQEYVSQSTVSSFQPTTFYTLGYCYFKRKQYIKSGECFQKYVLLTNTLIETRADAYNRLGDCLFSQRNYDAATSAYQKAEQLSPSAASYSLYQQAFIEGLRGNYQSKIAILSKITNGESNNINPQLSSMSLYEQGRAYIQSDDNQAALTTFQLLIQRYPQTTDARRAKNEIAMLYYEMGMTDEAISAYKKVITDSPNTQEAKTAFNSLKDIYNHLGQVNEYAELMNSMGEPLNAEEYDRVVLSAAEKALDVKDLKSAYKYYDQLASQTSSDEMRQRAQKGQLASAVSLKDLENSIDVASKIIADPKCNPELRAEALMTRAECYLSTKEPAKAVGDLRELSNDSVTVYGAQAVVRLAQYAYDTKQYKDAETLLLKFTDSNTEHYYWLARGFILLSDVYTMTNRKLEAKEYLLALKSNYTDSEEINQMIEKRLNQLK